MPGIFKKVPLFNAYLIVAPFVVCTVVAVVIVIVGGLSSFSWSNLLLRVAHLYTGVIAHDLAWLLGIVWFQWDMRPTIRGTWKFSVLGFVLTYILLAIFIRLFRMEMLSLIRLLIEVATICFVVQVFLFQFGFYRYIYRLLKEHGLSETKASGWENRKEQLLTLRSNDRIEKVSIDTVSHISVRDHYCTVFFQKENRWEQRMVYEKLKNYESRFKNHLVKINRSTLVNPSMVGKIEKSAGKYWVFMKGELDSPISLSVSQKHLLDNLIPIVS